MDIGMSACGILCSGCPAYRGKTRGAAHQERTAEAWRRIYELGEQPANINCGGCLGPDEGLFHTSIGCKARLCCRSKGLSSYAQCDVDPCPDLQKAQSVWDGVPEIAKRLSEADAATYAAPYCGHRQRLAAARDLRRRSASGNAEK
ncbi:MAG: DUF3795 domain-containing protein [Phycisphaerae bacterium]